MLTFEFEVTNDGARKLLHEIEDFLEFENSKMAAERPDPIGGAPIGWVLGDKVRRALAAAIGEQDRKFAAQDREKLGPPPSTRERWKGAERG